MSAKLIDHMVWAVPNLERAAEALSAAGFRLTPRAIHPSGMGTANQLIQLSERSFVELLEVDRPNDIDPHDHSGPQGFFSFGAYTHEFLRMGAGLSQLVIRTDSARQEADRFAKCDIGRFAPFDFGRIARQPDGTERKVAFRLAFAWSRELPLLGCFACENRFPENFWKTHFQEHDNGATGIATVYVSAPHPGLAASFLENVTQARAVSGRDGWTIALSESQSIEVMTPRAYRDRMPDAPPTPVDQAVFAGLSLRGLHLPGASLVHQTLGRSVLLAS